MSQSQAPPPALQSRSQLTQDRLCDAAEEALREGGLACCTIQEVARRAGRSVGSVYRRFGDKDRMIISVMQRYLERAELANKANLRILTDRYPDLESRLRALIHGAAQGHRRDWRLAQAFRDAAAGSSNAAMTEALFRVRDIALGLAKQALLGCSSEIMHADKEQAAEFAVNILLGAIEVMVRGPSRLMTDDVFQAELHEMLLGYLAPAANGS